MHIATTKYTSYSQTTTIQQNVKASTQQPLSLHRSRDKIDVPGESTMHHEAPVAHAHAKTLQHHQIT